jgi:hypothetical protein
MVPPFGTTITHNPYKYQQNFYGANGSYQGSAQSGPGGNTNFYGANGAYQGSFR